MHFGKLCLGVFEGGSCYLFFFFCGAVCGVLNYLTLILHQLLKLFPFLPLYFCPVKEILGDTV